MNILHIQKISTELALVTDKVKATAALLSDAATVPFIARYRKEATGSLDEVAITVIRVCVWATRLLIYTILQNTKHMTWFGLKCTKQ